MKTKVTFILFILFSSHIFAQDIEVKGLKTISASSANAGVRKDNNGTPSGLVRVQLKEAGAQFSGSILGDVEYKNGEYWVYMATGSKRLNIKHPDFLPVTVVFATLGVDKVKSGAEYQMLTKANKEKPKAVSNKKGMVAIQLTPSNATLSVDGTPAQSEGGGQYTLNLPYGTHYYSVKYGDFAIENLAVKVDKQPKAINVDLTEYFAKVKVNCKEKDASIYINDELRGVGSCDELVTPGKYVIQARKDGYHPLSQTVTLEDNEEFSMTFNDMKAMTGTLKVEFDPIGADVYLDGKKVGVTPLTMESVTLGKHRLEIKKEKCTSETRNITIMEEKQLVVKGSLGMPIWVLLHNEAAKGNGCAMNYLGYLYANRLYGEGPEWFNDGPCRACYEDFCKKANDVSISDFFYSQEFDSLSDIHKALDWLKQATTASFTHKASCGNYSAMLNVSTCYAALKQFKEAFYWANKCAQEYKGDHGDPYYYLAWFYYYGKGVDRDVTKAKQIAQKAVGRRIGWGFDFDGNISYDSPPYNTLNEVLNSYNSKCMPGLWETSSDFEDDNDSMNFLGVFAIFDN